MKVNIPSKFFQPQRRTMNKTAHVVFILFAACSLLRTGDSNRIKQYDFREKTSMEGAFPLTETVVPSLSLCG